MFITPGTEENSYQLHFVLGCMYCRLLCSEEKGSNYPRERIFWMSYHWPPLLPQFLARKDACLTRRACVNWSLASYLQTCYSLFFTFAHPNCHTSRMKRERKDRLWKRSAQTPVFAGLITAQYHQVRQLQHADLKLCQLFEYRLFKQMTSRTNKMENKIKTNV